MWKVTSLRSVKVRHCPLSLGVRDNQLLVCNDDVMHVLSTLGDETHIVTMAQRIPDKAVAQLTSSGFVIMDRLY